MNIDHDLIRFAVSIKTLGVAVIAGIAAPIFYHFRYVSDSKKRIEEVEENIKCLAKVEELERVSNKLDSVRFDVSKGFEKMRDDIREGREKNNEDIKKIMIDVWKHRNK